MIFSTSSGQASADQRLLSAQKGTLLNSHVEIHGYSRLPASVTLHVVRDCWAVAGLNTSTSAPQTFQSQRSCGTFFTDYSHCATYVCYML